MKTCGKCGDIKAYSEFHRNARRSDGCQSHCKACAKVRNHAYYLATPERNGQRHEGRNRARQLAREHVWSVLALARCIDCGESDPVVLDFDHVRGVKDFSVSYAVNRSYSVERVALEIAKCEVRCANCHRRVTAQRGGWTRARRP